MVLVVLAGCAKLEHGVQSPLTQPRMSADSVVLDLYFVQLPADEALDEQLWGELDEQRFSPELRQRLSQNGFRAGVSSWYVPEVLEEFLGDEPSRSFGLETIVEPSDSPPRVLHRHLSLRAGHPGEIVAPGIHERLPVMVREGGEVRGHTFKRAQAVWTIRAHAQSDGRALIEMVPEIQHGDPKTTYVAGEAMLLLDVRRPKEVYKALRIEAALAPGEMLFLGSIPQRVGSLGHHFFAASRDSHDVRRLLVIRLAQTQHDELFGTDDVAEPSPVPSGL